MNFNYYLTDIIAALTNPHIHMITNKFHAQFCRNELLCDSLEVNTINAFVLWST